MIKNDRWIIEQAEKGMIQPFMPQLVRHLDLSGQPLAAAQAETESAESRRVISYGLSSYGYDLRLSPKEFKVFRHIPGTIINPKRFNPDNLETVKLHSDEDGDYFVIPAHSYGLGVALERLDVPPNVTVICIGKCLVGSTRVVDAQTGAYLPIQDFQQPSTTVSMGNSWEMATTAVSRWVCQGVKPVYELTTRTGLKIRATANHPFRQLMGWTQLQDLKPGDRIAVARSIPIFGQESLPDWEPLLLGLMISDGQCHTPGHSPTFTTADPVLAELARHCVEAGFQGTTSFNGKYGYRLVNKRGHGGVIKPNRVSQWLQQHSLWVKSEDKFVPQAIFTSNRRATKLFLQALFSGDGSVFRNNDLFCVEYYSRSRRLIEDVHHLLLRFGIFSFIKTKPTHLGDLSYFIQMTDKTQILKFYELIGFYPGSLKQIRLETEIIPEIQAHPAIKSNYDTLPEEAWGLLDDSLNQKQRSFASVGVHPHRHQSVSHKVATQVAIATETQMLNNLVNVGPVWDTVVEIVPAGVEEVYDLSVPEFENFIANDLIVHNSTYARAGIIANLTPAEAAWRGHLTLEFSNSSSADCRIYANEGIVQLLFFEGEPCDVSYADRRGKYQDQAESVTLARV